MKKILAFAGLFSGFVFSEEKAIFSAYQTKSTLPETTSATTVITSDEIEEIKPHTVAELLNTVPDISFTSNGGFGQPTNLYLRGFRQRETVFMIDGIRINDPTNLNGVSIEHLLPVYIERIEIVKGSQSGVWGADAAAGVINIITKRPKKGFSANSYAEYGSFVTRRYGTTVSFANDKVYFQLGLHRFDSQSISAAEPAKGSRDYGRRWKDLGMEPDPYRNDTVNLKAGVNLTDKDKVEFNYNSVDAIVHYDGYRADANNVSHHMYKFYSLSYDRQFSDNKLTVYYNQSDFERRHTEPAGWIPFYSYDGKFKEFGFRNRWDYRPDSFVVFGAVRQDFTDDSRNVSKSYHNTGYFLTNINRFGKLTLSESIKFDNYSAFSDKTTYKVGAKYNLYKDIYVFANHGTAYLVPIPYQLYSQYGNPNLKPQTSTNYDIGLSGKNFGLTYFNYRVEDKIDFDMKNFKYANIEGESKIHGFEADFRYSFKPLRLTVSSGYAYTWAIDKDGKKLPRIPQDKVNFTVNYYPVDSLSLTLWGEYIGKRKDSLFNPVQTGYYTLLNFTANYRVNQNFRFYVKVDNLTDKFYQTVDGYASPSRSVYAGVSIVY